MVVVVRVVVTAVTIGDNNGTLPWVYVEGGVVDWLGTNGNIGGEGLVSMSSTPFIMALFFGDTPGRS